MAALITDPLFPEGSIRPFAFTTPGPVTYDDPRPGDADWDTAEQARMVAAVVSLAGFLRYMWPEITPGRELVWGKHMDVVCYGLEAAVFGHVADNELVINIPPRHLKSTMVAQALPAWLWLHRPSTQVLTISTGDKVITQNNRAIRRCVTSERYRKLVDFAREFLKPIATIPRWELEGDQNEKRRFENTAGGICQGLPAGADIIGIGCDLQIIDDPVDSKDTKDGSPDNIAAMMYRVIDNYGGTWHSRLNDPERGVRITIMQRLHPLDLAGFLLDGIEEADGRRRGGGVESIVLPTEYDPDHPHACGLDWRTTPGELLFPERLGDKLLRRIKATWEPSEYAAQHDQRPVPKGGGQFALDMWSHYDGSPGDMRNRARLEGGMVFSSWDCANKIGIRNAYTVGYVFAYFPPSEGDLYGDLFVIDRYRGQVESGGLDAAYNEYRTRWRTDVDLVEDAQNGTSLIQTYLTHPKHNMVAVSPHMYGGKTVRANHTLRRLGRLDRQGRRTGVKLWLPQEEYGAWVRETKTEHAHFPIGTYADQVDALSQGVLYVDVILPGDDGPPSNMGWVAGLQGMSDPVSRAIRRMGAA